MAPKPVEQPQDYGTGVTAKITNTKGVEMKDVMPGEIAGPAVAVTVEFSNKSGKEISLSNTIVSLNYAGQEASPFGGPPAQAPPEKLANGQSATAVYVFGVPANSRKNVKILVSYSPEAPLAEFNGAVG